MVQFYIGSLLLIPLRWYELSRDSSTKYLSHPLHLPHTSSDGPSFLGRQSSGGSTRHYSSPVAPLPPHLTHHRRHNTHQSPSDPSLVLGKMSLDPPTYLASLQNNIRQRAIPWDGAVRAGTLTDTQLAKIRAVDKAKRDVRKKTVEADLEGYRILFAGEPGSTSVLESTSRHQDVVQYILVLLNDILDGS